MCSVPPVGEGKRVYTTKLFKNISGSSYYKSFGRCKASCFFSGKFLWSTLPSIVLDKWDFAVSHFHCNTISSKLFLADVRGKEKNVVVGCQVFLRIFTICSDLIPLGVLLSKLSGVLFFLQCLRIALYLFPAVKIFFSVLSESMWPAGRWLYDTVHVQEGSHQRTLSNPSVVSGWIIYEGRFSIPLSGCKLFLQSWLFFFN